MKEAIIRLVVFAVLALNQTLVLFGWNPLPFSEEEIYAGVSSVALAAQGIYVWYRNNSVTKEAQKADEYLAELKDKKKAEK